MATFQLPCSRKKVLGSVDLLGEIMLRVSSSKQLLLCSTVSPHWRATAKGAAFRRLFSDRHQPAHIGFIVEMQEGPGRVQKLMYGDESEESDVAIRRHINPVLLGMDNILSTRNGFVLTRREGEGYFTSLPWAYPRVYTAVAPDIPRIPSDAGQHTINTFGQFGLMLDAGRDGMGFFVKQASRNFLTCYDGVSFCSSTNIFVHLCVYDAAIGWQRYVSNPIESPEAAVFHRNPYSVIVGKKMYLMYVLGFVVCFDIVTKTFTEIALPIQVSETISSWYDYTVASHRGGGIVLVHYYKGNLHRWVLSYINGVETWIHELMVDLIDAFGNLISEVAWQRVIGREAFPIGSDHFFSMQARNSSPDGRYVLVTFGFNLGMYEVDMNNFKVVQITNVARSGMLGRICVMSETWPAIP